MLEKEISKRDLVKIKREFHEAIAETTPLGVADKCLINGVIDRLYEENFDYNIPKESFLAMVRTELSNYSF